VQGVLAGGKTTPASTATGEVVTDAIPGYPDIPWSSLRTYINRLSVGNTVASYIRVFDRIWMSGAYAFNAAVATVSPSFASRVSYAGGSADYSGLELWCEGVTTGTLVQSATVVYTNQAGTHGG
jgi:hypothetical protein